MRRLRYLLAALTLALLPSEANPDDYAGGVQALDPTFQIRDRRTPQRLKPKREQRKRRIEAVRKRLRESWAKAGLPAPGSRAAPKAKPVNNKAKRP